MFVFALGEKYKAKGLSSDAIAANMRNRFNFLCEEGMLQDCLQVRFGEKAVRFFFYDKAEADNGNGVVVEEHYKEVASISLTNRKETGHDILYLKKQIEAKLHEISCLNENDFELWKNACKKIVNFDEERGTAFDDFPFVRQWNWEQTKIEEWFTFFIQCCFLDFILNLEDRESSFSVSPYYDEVRDRLRECKVYQLLCAKVKYAMYLYCGEDAFSKDEYTFKTQRFADLLMDANINKIIPPYYYFEKLWFYDPEEELDLIVKKDYASKTKKGGARLDAKLQNKIRDYFFRHHAVVSGMGNKVWKIAYCIYLFVIGAFSVWATYSLLWFDETNNKIVDFFFKHIVIWDYIALASLVFLLFLSCVRSINVVMPRVIVAIGIGWLTAFVSEDLIKSQLEIKPMFTAIACAGVLILIVIMLFGEAKQHSPYYILGIKEYFSRHLLHIWKYPSKWKLLPIIVHSFFWVLTTGVVMQFALYEDLLKNSKALPDIVYAANFEEANDYIVYLNNLKTALEDYQHELDGRFVKTTIKGIMKGAANTSSFLTASPNYDTKEIIKMQERDGKKINNIDVLYNKIVMCHIKACGNTLQDPLPRIKDSIIVDSCLVHMSFGERKMIEIKSDIQSISDRAKSVLNCNNDTKLEEYMRLQLDDLEVVLSAVDKELQAVHEFVFKNNNYCNLIGWSQSYCPLKTGTMSFCDYLQFGKPHQHFFCREINMWWIDQDKPIGQKPIKVTQIHIFPRMLIFHSLIVLIIAFVGQLIVSDKSVTEPL